MYNPVLPFTEYLFINIPSLQETESLNDINIIEKPHIRFIETSPITLKGNLSI